LAGHIAPVTDYTLARQNRSKSNLPYRAEQASGRSTIAERGICGGDGRAPCSGRASAIPVRVISASPTWASLNRVARLGQMPQQATVTPAIFHGSIGQHDASN